MFVKENVNPKNKKCEDCVIRAIAKAEDRAWEDVFNDLIDIARKKYCTQTDTVVYTEYLKKYSTIKVFYENGEGKRKRYTVKDVCRFDGAYVVVIAGHLTAVVDGNYYDTWDCGNKSSYKIWKIK